MTQNKQAAAAQLRSVIDEGTGALERLSRSARRLSLEGTATLVGTFGGFAGLSAAYGLAVVMPTISFLFAGPVGIGLGITGSLIAFRGTSSAKLDRQIDERRRAANYMLGQIKQLPRSAPASVRESLYAHYHRAVTGNDIADSAPAVQIASPVQHQIAATTDD